MVNKNEVVLLSILPKYCNVEVVRVEYFKLQVKKKKLVQLQKKNRSSSSRNVQFLTLHGYEYYKCVC